ncbi:hypothetical protein ACFV0W_15765 [Streptomyces anulatus]
MSTTPPVDAAPPVGTPPEGAAPLLSAETLKVAFPGRRGGAPPPAGARGGVENPPPPGARGCV